MITLLSFLILIVSFFSYIRHEYILIVQVSNNIEDYRATLKTCTIPPVASSPLRGHTAHHLQCTLLAPFLGIDIIHSTRIHAPVSFFNFSLFYI